MRSAPNFDAIETLNAVLRFAFANVATASTANGKRSTKMLERVERDIMRQQPPVISVQELRDAKRNARYNTFDTPIRATVLIQQIVLNAFRYFLCFGPCAYAATKRLNTFVKVNVRVRAQRAQLKERDAELVVGSSSAPLVIARSKLSFAR